MTQTSQAARKNDFSFLDESSFRDLYSEGAGGNRMRFSVDGIRCAKCLRKIESLTDSTPGLTDVRVDMGKNLVHVVFEPARLKPSVIAGKISDLGFGVRPLTPGTEAEGAVRREDRQALIRLAVAGACAGNIMGFALAIYLGGEGEWLRLFSWLSFALYLPVVTYVAWPFYTGAWSSLRQGRISIDLPMAVASFAGFAFSTVQLVRGNTDFYFDSMSSFLFLILLARFVQRRLQRRYLAPQDPAEDLNRVRLFAGEGWTWTPADRLRPGDRFRLEAGEILPAEARLESERAHFSLAWLTGESRPRAFLEGAIVPAGARFIGSNAVLNFVKPLAQTDFGRTMDEVHRFSLSRNRMISTADRWTQWLLGIVFTIAGVFLAAHWAVSPEEAVHRALALIIIACPCAMAFGTPLAMAFSLKRARALGLLISDANVFEAVNNIGTVFFDKTGTLTDLDLTLAASASDIPPVYQKIVLALENNSLHPIAFAFRKAFPDLGKLPPVGAHKEIPGFGVTGYIFGKSYGLHRDPEFSGDGLSCALYEDDRLVYRFTFEAGLKPGVREALETLRGRGLSVRLLSGDKPEAALALGLRLGFAPGEIHGGLRPEDKAAIVAGTPRSMMVGDGVNDAAAMMKADAGIAVAGAVGAALKTAKIYLSSENMGALVDLFAISAAGFRLIRQNLAISLVYNCVAGTLALLGLVNPLVAAVLMPISSGIILFNTWRSGR